MKMLFQIISNKFSKIKIIPLNASFYTRQVELSMKHSVVLHCCLPGLFCISTLFVFLTDLSYNCVQLMISIFHGFVWSFSNMLRILLFKLNIFYEAGDFCVLVLPNYLLGQFLSDISLFIELHCVFLRYSQHSTTEPYLKLFVRKNVTTHSFIYSIG